MVYQRRWYTSGDAAAAGELLPGIALLSAQESGPVAYLCCHALSAPACVRRWCQVHFVEYGRYRIGALVQLVCDAYQVSRQQRQDMLSRIEQMSKEFAQG